MKLTAADLQRLQTATGRFVKLPDSGWVELDSTAVQSAHEAMAELGVDGLVPVAQRIGLEQAAHLDEEGLEAVRRFRPGQGAARAPQELRGPARHRTARHGAGGHAALSEGRVRLPLPPDPASGWAAFSRTTWAWARPCRRWRGWRGSRTGTGRTRSRRW